MCLDFLEKEPNLHNAEVKTYPLTMTCPYRLFKIVVK